MKLKTVLNKSFIVVLSLWLAGSVVFGEVSQKKEEKRQNTVNALVGEYGGETSPEYDPGSGSLSRLRIGTAFSYYFMGISDFKEVYGNIYSLGLDISYTLSSQWDIWLYGGYGTKSVAVEWSEQDLKFRFIPITLDLRYFLKRGPRLDLFAGAGVNIYPFKDTNPFTEVKDTAIGVNFLAGTYYHITGNFLLHLAMRLNLVKKTIENTDNPLKMNSLELLAGISYNL